MRQKNQEEIEKIRLQMEREYEQKMVESKSLLDGLEDEYK